jgi:hypothetical protein
VWRGRDRRDEFDELYAVHRDALFRLAMLICGDRPEGSYSGTEHYALGSDECPELDHTYDATLTGGSVAGWTLHEDYCGRIDEDDMWSGEGTFTITATPGDELTGTFVSEAPANGDGEPYTLTITGGTGIYAGASGECALDNHVEKVALGTQRQSGDISCSIVVPF